MQAMQFNPDISQSDHPHEPRPHTGLAKDLILLAGIIAMFVLLWPDPSAGTDPDNRNLKIVFEATVGNQDAADALITRVERTHDNFRDQAEITVIAYWDGVRMMRAMGNPLDERLAQLADGGIEFMVCQQSLKDAEMPDSDVVAFARTVKSGSEEARRLEKQGWARVRDGESYVSAL